MTPEEKLYKDKFAEKLMCLSNEELIKFIDEEFPREPVNSYKSYDQKIKALNSLNKAELSAAIARMTNIENIHDHTKLWPVGSLLVATSLVGLQIIFKVNIAKINDNNYLNALFYVVIAIIICLVFLYGMQKERQKVVTASYFKELLIQLKADNG
ncbi:hypothetical protein [Bacillus atrophaeus]|uniref:hypothetical protein n=1 Tax=Bacillus atrophaeus TaxID=1452 RepID=UPI002DC03E6E|nr:hypothetical protein [Bacillus atrophaeus]MEC2307605.1 hypothetical protein [Bacillus atrophaeus]